MTNNPEKSRKERRKEERRLVKKNRQPLPVDSPAGAGAPSPPPRPTSRAAAAHASVTAKSIQIVAPAVSTTSRIGVKRKSRTSASYEMDVAAAAADDTDDDPYAHLDPDVAAALRRDDDDIAALEAKLNIKDKKRLKREYAQLECYGDDFGDFLDDLDALTRRVVSGVDDTTPMSMLDQEDDDSMMNEEADDRQSDDEEDSDEEDEELVPMKAGAMEDLDDNEDDNHQQTFSESEDTSDGEDQILENNVNSIHHDDLSDDENNNEEGEPKEDDHDVSLTYQPTKGEDIYGNPTMSATLQVPPQKYIPPHLRASSSSDRPNDASKQSRLESLRGLERCLNNALNRLSEDKLVPVVQSIVQLYEPHPANDVNECYWKITLTTCVSRDHVTTGIIPLFVAAVVGVHLHKGDSAQLAEYMIEKLVVDLWSGLETARNDALHNDGDTVDESQLTSNKKVSNLALILCYFYNFGLLHCTLLYEIIRALLNACCEIDVEILLLILSHCGRTLRSDDPTAIQEIVLLVQQKALDKSIRTKISSSRCDYLVAAMTDLKNNKRRKQDQPLMDKTSKLRKSIGHLKSSIVSNTKSQRCSDASLRISLTDILEAESKGRWWKVGASWAGNHRLNSEADTTSKESNEASPQLLKRGAKSGGETDERLLVLASKYRMNTDARRTVFCIIMGSIDCEDCFEKLVRAEMLKNRSERDTVRVLMECCGNETSFNQYYSHLAARICEYQPQCKFTFQLAFWDTFKQFDDLKPRKVANLAKLLFHLVAIHNCLKINVIKAIDMAATDTLPETAMIFITIVLSSILEHYKDPGDVARLFAPGAGQLKSRATDSDEEEGDAVVETDTGDSETFRANLSSFLVQILQSSPKNKKGSTFRANLKAATKACSTKNYF